MPILLDADPAKAATLLTVLPAGTQVVDTADRLFTWLAHRSDEYAVVLGPSLAVPEAMQIADRMRTAMPTASVVLVRDTVDTNVLTQAMHAGVREVVYRRSLPLATANLRIVTATGGERAAIIGAACLVLDDVLAPDAIDQTFVTTA